MTYKTISGTYSSGYDLKAKFTGLSITSTGSVAGSGVLLSAYGGVSNSGTIQASPLKSDGIYLDAQGKVTNQTGGYISGFDGVFTQNYKAGELNDTSTVINRGIITATYAGVYLGQTGVVTNFDTIHGLSYGIRGSQVTLANYGAVSGGLRGVFAGNGYITNGSASATSASITGLTGVFSAGFATVTNFGAIDGTGRAASGSPIYAGVYLYSGGRVVNGGATDTTASITGQTGVLFDETDPQRSLIGTLVNYGTIEGSNTIAGTSGVYLGPSTPGSGTASLTNGSAQDTTALIAGRNGVYAFAAKMSIVNYGTIAGDGGFGLRMTHGGNFTNGAATSGSALITGDIGVEIDSPATAQNFGTIEGSSTGVLLTDGGNFYNGSAGDHDGTISGGAGGAVDAAGGGVTVVNYGVLTDPGGAAVQFGSATDTLVVGSGAVFDGAVNGGGGTLVLEAGAGTLSGMGGGTVTLTSGGEVTAFSNFGTITLVGDSEFIFSGNNTVGAGDSLLAGGALKVNGTLSVDGSLTTGGVLSGSGTLTLGGGTATFDPGTKLTIAAITQTDAGALAVVDADVAYAKLWTQSAGTVSVGARDKITFEGAGDSFAGTLTGAGTVAFTGGTDTWNGVTLSAAKTTVSGAAVTLAGVITEASPLSAAGSYFEVAAGGASLTGGGTITLSSNELDTVFGATAAATLTNVNDKIVGAAILGDGQMILVNQGTGILDATGDETLLIDPSSFTNAGLVEATGGGTALIAGAMTNAGTLKADGGDVTAQASVANNGLLEADGGTLTVTGAVTGTGSATIINGTLDLGAAFTQNVAFKGATGVLELAQSQGYAGAVTGFSKFGGMDFDLGDVGFVSAGEATFSGTTKSGVLTVTDGTHTATITLIGNYTKSQFTAASDNNGGVLVTVVAPPPGPGRFIAAMAGFGARVAGPPAGASHDVLRGGAPMLARPATA